MPLGCVMCADTALVHGAVALGRQCPVAQKKLTAREKRALVRQFSDAKSPCGAARCGAGRRLHHRHHRRRRARTHPRGNLIGLHSKRQGERIVTLARLADTRTVGGEACRTPWSEWAASADLAGRRQEILHG